MTNKNDDTVSLKEYFERVLSEQDKAVRSALASAEKAVNVALASAEKAVNVAEANAEKWRNNANEWRGAMTDREKNFVTRREVWLAVVAIAGFVLAILQFFK